MLFEPEKITKQDVLSAIKKIEDEKIELHSPTGYDVIIDGKAYPPEEVMRYADELMNGERTWEGNGGDPTNKYSEALEFTISEKLTFSEF